jgi:hypothetical protein
MTEGEGEAVKPRQLDKKMIREAAALLTYAAGANKEVIRGIEALKDLLLVGLEMRVSVE